MTTFERSGTPVFWQQPVAQRLLTQAVKGARLSRAYLFIGPEGVGKWAAAQWLAQVLLCESDDAARPCCECAGCRRVISGTHPDCRALIPVPTSTAEDDTAAFLAAKRDDPLAVVRFKKRPYLLIERVRALINQLNLTSIEGGAKVTIIAGAEQMAGDAQTILLKTVEEPPPDAYFVLTSADPGRLLPTLVSRCQMVRFAPVDPQIISARLVDERGLDRGRAELVAQASGGGWGNALRLLGEESEAWSQIAATFWDGAFRVPVATLLSEINKLFTPGRKVGFDLMMQSFDLWGIMLWRDCVQANGLAGGASGPGATIRDMETAWACRRILETGRSTLYVNVAERHAVAGTFLALRRRLGNA